MLEHLTLSLLGIYFCRMLPSVSTLNEWTNDYTEDRSLRTLLGWVLRLPLPQPEIIMG